MLVEYVKIVFLLFKASRSSYDKGELGLNILAWHCRYCSARVALPDLATPGLNLSRLQAGSDAQNVTWMNFYYK